MNVKIPIGFIILSIVAILMDCYAGRGFFLMTVMSMLVDNSLLYFGIVLTLLVFFIASIIGLFRLKKWGYYIFFALTFVVSFLLLLMDIEYLVKKDITLEFPQVFLMVFFLTFVIYFIKSSTRKLFEKKINAGLSVKWARINIIIIAVFYLISGIWEYSLCLTQMGWMPRGFYFLLDVYRSYAVTLGCLTILAGMLLYIGVLFRFNFVRLLALILAWWNLLTVPLIHIWWNVYAISIKKFFITDSWLKLPLYSPFHSAILIVILTFMRIYVISMLEISKAGYIFLKEKRLKNSDNIEQFN